MLRLMVCRGLVPEASTEHHHYAMVPFGVSGHLESHAPAVHLPLPGRIIISHSIAYRRGLVGCGTGLGRDGDWDGDAGIGNGWGLGMGLGMRV